MLEPFEEWKKSVLEKCRLIWDIIRSPLPEEDTQAEQTSISQKNTQPQNGANNTVPLKSKDNFKFAEWLQQKEELQEQMRQLQVQNQQAELSRSQRFASLHKECQKLQEDNHQLLEDKQGLESERDRARKAAIDLVLSVIYYRDRLFTQLEMANSEATGVGERVLKSMIGATEQILRDNQVTILRDEGAFSVDDHETVSVEITDKPELDGQIATTIREGYLFQNQLLRRQQVVVYQYKEPEA